MQQRPQIARLVAGAALCAFMFACSSQTPIVRTFPKPAAQNGSIQLKLSAPIAGVMVSLNGEKLVERAFAQTVTIEQVPAGEVKLHVVGYTPVSTLRIEEYMGVQVLAGQISEVEIAVPNESSGDYMLEFAAKASTMAIALIAGSLAVVELFADDENSDDDPFAPGF